MTIFFVTRADLRYVHQTLCIREPMEELSPAVRMILMTVASHGKCKALAGSIDDRHRATNFMELIRR